MILEIAERVVRVDEIEPYLPLAKDAALTMRYCLRHSEFTWIAKVDGTLACVWGVITPTMISTSAYLWMLHRPEVVDRHKFMMVRQSQRVMSGLRQRYALIVGDCLVGQTHSIRWMSWLGATFGPAKGRRLPFSIQGAQ